MPSRILASFVPFLFVAANLAQAARFDGDDCCPTGCTVKCESNSCVARPNCPCPAKYCAAPPPPPQYHPHHYCENGNCKITPAVVPPLKSEQPVARKQVAPRATTAKSPARGRTATQAATKPAGKRVVKVAGVPTRQAKQAPAKGAVAVAQATKEKPTAEKSNGEPAEKTSPEGLTPITAEELSLPPLGKPLPAVKAGVVENAEPRSLYVLPAGATNAIQKQSHNVVTGNTPAMDQKADVVTKSSAQDQRLLMGTSAPRVRPMSEISPSRDPLPPPMAPDYSSIRRK